MKIFHVNNNFWHKNAVECCSKSNVLCLGNNNDIQWFGTSLSKALALKENSEVSDLYGKLINSLDDFCYQLCHSTPWGFEMGRNLNAVVDVFRGNTSVNEKFFIWHDADHLMNKNRKLFIPLFEIMIEMDLERAEYGLNHKSIFLFPNTKYAEIKKLLKHKEKYKIEIVEIEL